MPNINRFEFISNTLYSGIAEFSSLFLYIFSILVARALGPSDYGLFMLALSLGTIYSIFIRFGFFGYLSRELPLLKGDSETIIQTVITAQIWLFAITTVIAIPIVVFLPKPPHDKLIVCIIAGAMLIQAFKFTFRGILRGLDRFKTDSLIVIIERLLLLIVAVLCMNYGWSVLTVAYAFFIVRLVDFINSYFRAAKHIKSYFRADHKSVWDVIGKAWPFASMMLLYQLYNYSDSIMLSLMKENKDVGLYNVAYQVIEGSQLFPSTITGSLLPLLTINYLTDSTYCKKLFNFSTELMHYASLPIVVFIFIYADAIIILLYGESYRTAIPALQIIALAIPAFFLSIVARCVYYAERKEKMYMKIFGASVVLNIILNIPLILYYGFLGACVSTLITELLLFFILAKKMEKLSIQFDLISTIRKPLILNGIFLILILLAHKYHLNVIIAGIAFAAIYLFFISILKLIDIRELKLLK